MFSPIISFQELINLENEVLIIDARTGPEAASNYAQGHIKNALAVNLETDLSLKIKDPANGGRHPLPNLNDFAELLGKLGINPQSHVVVYDDKGGANAAARFWWMLRAVGHKKVQVLDGGIQVMVRANIPLSSDLPSANIQSPYPVENWNDLIVSIDDVEKAIADKSFLVVDARERYRFLGESEPIDKIAGHIENAINIPYVNNLKEDGTFKSADELNQLYTEKISDIEPSNVYMHCGSGVTACHNLLAMEIGRISGARLYVGSWSEWSNAGKKVINETK